MGNNELLSRTYPRSSSNTSSSFLDRSNTSSPDNTSATASSPEEEEEDEWTYNRSSDQNNSNNNGNRSGSGKTRISRGSLGSVHEEAEDDEEGLDPELVGYLNQNQGNEVNLNDDEELDPAFGDAERLVLEGDESEEEEEVEEDVRRTPRAGGKKKLGPGGGSRSGKKEKVERVLKGSGVMGLVKRKQSKGEVLGDWAVTGR